MVKPIETVLAPFNERREAEKQHLVRLVRLVREERFGKRASAVREPAWDRSNRKGK